jgi:hypothetical protein
VPTLQPAPHPSWIPLCRGPFVFRHDPDIDGPVELDGTCDAYFETLIAVPEIKEVKIDRAAGQFCLSFHPRQNGLFNAVEFHPLEIDGAYIRDPNLRSLITQFVGRAWLIMAEQFRAAVRIGGCTLFARAGSPLKDFTPVAPDIFDHFEVTNWFKGTATTEAGEMLYSLHVAPSEYTGGSSQAQQIAPTEPQLRQRKWPRAQLRENAKAAVDGIREQRGTIDDLPDVELVKLVGDWMKNRGQKTPSAETIRRAAGRRKVG